MSKVEARAYSKKVKLFHLFIVGMLLSNLGMTLVADFFEKESHIAISNSEVTAYQQHQAEDREHNDSVGCDSTTPEQDHCPDPCHTGQPHFGHASFLFANTVVKFYHQTINKNGSFETQSNVEQPFLEGPRRPPKVA